MEESLRSLKPYTLHRKQDPTKSRTSAYGLPQGGHQVHTPTGIPEEPPKQETTLSLRV